MGNLSITYAKVFVMLNLTKLLIITDVLKFGKMHNYMHGITLDYFYLFAFSYY